MIHILFLYIFSAYQTKHFYSISEVMENATLHCKGQGIPPGKATFQAIYDNHEGMYCCQKRKVKEACLDSPSLVGSDGQQILELKVEVDLNMITLGRRFIVAHLLLGIKIGF